MALIDKIKNWWFPFSTTPSKDTAIRKDGAMDLGAYIAPMQFTRVAVDVDTWRESITEAENPILPYRVKQQRIYADTYLNGQTYAAITKRKNLTLLKEKGLFNGDTLNESATAMINQSWFDLIISYCLDAQFFGYSPIGLGGMENDSFPNIKLIKRENVSPDRLCISPVIYSPQGSVYFMDKEAKDENGLYFNDWIIYVDTPSETGQSRCGYGLLYKVALYEIYLRHNLADNATFTELFCQPYRVAKTDKTQTSELEELDKNMKNLGASGYAIIGHNDDIEFLSDGAGGNGYKGYESLETRLEKKISKIILGHADAIDSTPGKLGAGNGEESPVNMALLEIEAIDNKFIENIVNGQILPKLRKIGLKIPEGLVFKYFNNSETQEKVEKQNLSNTAIASWVKNLSDSGFEVDPIALSEMMGITITKKPEPEVPAFEPSIQEKIKNIYRS